MKQFKEKEEKMKLGTFKETEPARRLHGPALDAPSQVRQATVQSAPPHVAHDWGRRCGGAAAPRQGGPEPVVARAMGCSL